MIVASLSTRKTKYKTKKMKKPEEIRFPRFD